MGARSTGTDPHPSAQNGEAAADCGICHSTSSSSGHHALSMCHAAALPFRFTTMAVLIVTRISPLFALYRMTKGGISCKARRLLCNVAGCRWI